MAVEATVESADLLLCNDVAKVIKKSAKWVRYLIDTGQIPAYRTPAGVRIVRRVDLERYIEERIRTLSG